VDRYTKLDFKCGVLIQTTAETRLDWKFSKALKNGGFIKKIKHLNLQSGVCCSQVDGFDRPVSPDILLHPATYQCTGCTSIAALSCKDKEKSSLVSFRFLTKK
jgi:hypothetical protein